MKVKVVKSFVDLQAKAVREVGSLFECNEKRFKEIEKAGHFVEKVAKEASASKK